MVSLTSSTTTASIPPTIWGLTPVQLHDRFWAASGVQVVRPGEASEIVADAELFLLTDRRTLCVFKLRRAIEHLIWVKPDVLFVRLHDDRERGYRERVVTGPDARFVRFERIYGGSDSRLARVGLTPDRRLAQLWQNSPDARSGWRALREEVTRSLRSVVSVNGAVYDRDEGAEVMQFVRGLVACWKTPSSTVGRARGDRGSVWADVSASIGDEAMFIGPTWVGAGRRVSFPTSIVGPAILWDDPAARPEVEELSWLDIEPTMNLERTLSPARRTGFSMAMK